LEDLVELECFFPSEPGTGICQHVSLRCVIYQLSCHFLSFIFKGFAETFFFTFKNSTDFIVSFSGSGSPKVTGPFIRNLKQF
jgi:hypothetical protein